MPTTALVERGLTTPVQMLTLVGRKSHLVLEKDHP